MSIGCRFMHALDASPLLNGNNERMSVSVVAGPRFEPTRISRPASKLDRPVGRGQPSDPSTPERDFVNTRSVSTGRGKTMEVCSGTKRSRRWRRLRPLLSMFQTPKLSRSLAYLGGHTDAVKKAKKIPIYGKRTPTAVLPKKLKRFSSPLPGGLHAQGHRRGGGHAASSPTRGRSQGNASNRHQGASVEKAAKSDRSFQPRSILFREEVEFFSLRSCPNY